MNYMGGKGLIAKELVRIIEGYREPGQMYLEPFLGSAATFHLMAGPKEAGDSHEALMTMWLALLEGWEPPKAVDESLYWILKKRKDPTDPLTAFVGFGCSFGGKWWGGYARNGKGHNYVDRAGRLVQWKARGLRGANLVCRDYREWKPRRALIYADPPYVSTTRLHAVDEFDTGEFWLWAERMVREKNTVLVSEYKAPKGWVMIWEAKTHNTGTLKPIARRERLFLHHTQVKAMEQGRLTLL